MFIDSENLDYIKQHSDSDYSNHIKWYTGKGHNESHRYSDAYDDAKKDCKVSSSDTCVKINDALQCAKNKMNYWEKGKRTRVTKRHTKAFKNWRNKIQGWYNDDDCEDVLNVSVGGCTDISALNYDNNATYDDSSCEFADGCTDSSAENYNSDATSDDSSCTFKAASSRIYGCRSKTAKNYNKEATHSDASCEFDEEKMKQDKLKDLGIFDYSDDINKQDSLLKTKGSSSSTEEDDNTVMYGVIGVAVLAVIVIIIKN